jgi:hypothetical protein
MTDNVFCEKCSFECWDSDPIIVYKVCNHVFHRTCLLTEEFSLLNPRCPCCDFGHIMSEAPISKDISKAPISKAPISKAPFQEEEEEEEEEEEIPSFLIDDDDFEINSNSDSSIFWGLITTAMSVAIIIKQAINY